MGNARIKTRPSTQNNDDIRMINILRPTKNHSGLSLVITLLLLLNIFHPTNSSFANDTVAEITPNGLQFKTEENISIEREDLYISLNKIEVSYIFKNHSDKDITVEVAFPIPPYWGLEVANIPYSHYPLNFSDFIAEADGKKIDYKKEVRAFSNGNNKVDVTDFPLLLEIGVLFQQLPELFIMRTQMPLARKTACRVFCIFPFPCA
ncbi:MAG: DUF4424 family protein [Nitrospirae bacterium]|nr:DUF4424 family protein [Nitrospirota bacterium]